MPGREPDRSDPEPRAYRVVSSIVRAFMTTTTRTDWQRTDRLPRTGGYVIVANHTSNFDPLALAHVVHDSGRMVRFLAKASLFSIPVLGTVFGAAGQIPVFRNSSRAGDAYRAAVDVVTSGGVVIVYPEGTITLDPELWPMSGKTGAARIALQTGCPVVPIVTWGAHEVLRRGRRGVHLLPRHTMHARVGDPVELDRFRDRPITSSLLNEATAVIMRTLADELAELRGQPAPAELFRR